MLRPKKNFAWIARVEEAQIVITDEYNDIVRDAPFALRFEMRNEVDQPFFAVIHFPSDQDRISTLQEILSTDNKGYLREAYRRIVTDMQGTGSNGLMETPHQMTLAKADED